MKKLLVLLLLFFYLLPVIGISVNAHYCGGELASLSLLDTGKPPCACKGEMKPGCCEDQSHIFKIEDEQQASLTLSPDFQTSHYLYIGCVPGSADLHFSSVEHFFSTIHHPPPDEARPSLFLLNRVFRI